MYRFCNDLVNTFFVRPPVVLLLTSMINTLMTGGLLHRCAPFICGNPKNQMDGCWFHSIKLSSVNLSICGTKLSLSCAEIDCIERLSGATQASTGQG